MYYLPFEPDYIPAGNARREGSAGSPPAGPPEPRLRQRFSTIAEENAEVDAYEAEKERLREVLRQLTAGDAWRAEFPIADHVAIERVRSIISRRLGEG